MKINSLTMMSFRNHTNSHFDFDHLNLIFGFNASGKSSTLYALQAALSGRCAVTDRGGRGLDNLIRQGSKAARVQLVAESAGASLAIDRTITAKGQQLQVNEWAGGVKDQQAALYDAIGADSDLIDCLLNVTAFPGMGAKEQREMLVKLAGVAMPATELEGTLEADLTTLEDLVDLPETITSEDADNIYGHLFRTRADLKKDLATSEGRLGGVTDTIDASLPDPSELPDIKAQLATLEKELAAAQESRAEGAANVSKAQELDRRIGANLELQKQLKEEHAKFANATFPPEGGTPTLDAELTDALRARDDAKAKAANLSGQITAKDETIKVIKKSTKCPLSDEMKCLYTKDQRKDLVGKLEVERVKLVNEHTKSIDDITATSMAVSELTILVDQAKAGSVALARYNQIEAELAALKETIEDDSTEMARLASLPTADEAPTDLVERIRNGNALVGRVQAAQEARTKADGAADKVEALRDEVATLERLVGFFGPGADGIKALMLSEAIERIQIAVSNTMTDLSGGTYSVEIATDPEWVITVNNGTDTVPLAGISASEQFRVGVAFAVELSRLAGLGLLVLDGAEILDAENRAALSGYLNTLDDFDTIILIATRDEAPRVMGETPGVAWFWVENGNVKSLAGSRV